MPIQGFKGQVSDKWQDEPWEANKTLIANFLNVPCIPFPDDQSKSDAYRTIVEALWKGKTIRFVNTLTSYPSK